MIDLPSELIDGILRYLQKSEQIICIKASNIFKVLTTEELRLISLAESVSYYSFSNWYNTAEKQKKNCNSEANLYFKSDINGRLNEIKTLLNSELIMMYKNIINKVTFLVLIYDDDLDDHYWKVFYLFDTIFDIKLLSMTSGGSYAENDQHNKPFYELSSYLSYSSSSSEDPYVEPLTMYVKGTDHNKKDNIFTGCLETDTDDILNEYLFKGYVKTDNLLFSNGEFVEL